MTARKKSEKTAKPKGGLPVRSKGAGQARRGPGRALAWLFAKSVKWVTVTCVWALIGGIGLAAWYATDLPDVDAAFEATRRPVVRVLAADGSELAAVGDVYGRQVRLSELPVAMTQAVLATEDRRFYGHFGLDPIGLARAMVANVKAGRIVQGGSTITQQVAKNLFLTPERTLKRKVQEVMLALWLEHRFSKDQILAIYLNRVYMGAGTWGVEAASQKYFHRPASRLTTYQAAMLAGMLKAPSRYNPIADAERAHTRTRQVLRNMVAAGYLDEPAAAGAKADVPAQVARRPPRIGRHFADWVLEQVPDFVNPGDRDIVVRTTLDPKLQAQAERAVERALAKGSAAGISEAALVAMTPAGAIRAMVGGRRYAESQFNRAVHARRQPGSAFKPFVYLAALEAGLGPRTVFEDAPIDIKGWRPRNFSGEYAGNVTMIQALAQSINSVAVRASEKAGRGRVIKVARRLGLSADYQRIPSLALGVADVTLLELTQAYAPFANGGAGVIAHGITEIRDGRGAVLYERRGSGPGRVVSAEYVADMNAMLAQVVAGGTGRAAAIGRPQAGKTGTSQNFRDAWFVGYTAELVAGVWMGNDRGAPMRRVTGGSQPARLWRDVMAAAHQGLQARALPGAAKHFEFRPVGDDMPDDGSGFWQNFIANLTGG